jgi:hypothetical protein
MGFARCIVELKTLAKFEENPSTGTIFIKQHKIVRHLTFMGNLDYAQRLHGFCTLPCLKSEHFKKILQGV